MLNPAKSSSVRRFGLTLFKDRLPVPRVLQPESANLLGHKTLRIGMVRKQVQLHSELAGKTRVWSYAGLDAGGNPQTADMNCFLGPTVEVDATDRLMVEWSNHIDGPLPMRVCTDVSTPSAYSSDADIPQNKPGGGAKAPAERDPNGIEAMCVSHLHGGRTRPDSDGWTDNVLVNGQSKISQYGPEPRSMMLWYHDHAMGVTRLNVMVGLAGAWLVRDAAEKALNLPSHQHEVPLVIKDCNLDTAADGSLLPALLHKTETQDQAQDHQSGPTNEFFGPFTMVNGAIWPHLEVHPGWYRFRLLNAANARTFGLLLRDREGNWRNDRIRLIGTDGGFTAQPIQFASDQPLILAPAERADVLIDFTGLHGELTLFNVLDAPFGGDATVPDFAAGFPQGRLAEPSVMQFRVRPAHVPTFTLPPALPTDYLPIKHTDMGDHEHRVLLLLEQGGVLTFRELVEAPADLPSTTPVVEIAEGSPPVINRYVVGSEMFNDTTTIFAKLGGNEIWKIINLTPDTHPFHIHQVEFRVLGRKWVVGTDSFEASMNGTSAPLVVTQEVVAASSDPVEQGWKDVIRANPGDPGGGYGQMTIIGIKNIGPYAGRYMYHCHVLEHEDMDMMRPWVILPDPVAGWMSTMGGMPPMPM